MTSPQSERARPRADVRESDRNKDNLFMFSHKRKLCLTLKLCRNIKINKERLKQGTRIFPSSESEGRLVPQRRDEQNTFSHSGAVP